MNRIQDFQCTYEKDAGLTEKEVLEAGLKFPDVYLYAGEMAKLAKLKKEKSGDAFCELPFDHTAEAEALGAVICPGNGISLPRAGEYRCISFMELQELPEMNLAAGRMKEILTACRLLTEEGETVVLNISGPFSIWNSLTEIGSVFKAVRKEPETMIQLLGKVRRDLLRLIQEAGKAGVTAFSYADPAGAVNILGSKMTAQVTERFTVPFLREAQEMTGRKAVILLCPKTVAALLGTENAVQHEIRLEKAMTYGEACIWAVGKARLVGQMCLKNKSYLLQDKRLKEVILRPDSGGEHE